MDTAAPPRRTSRNVAAPSRSNPRDPSRDWGESVASSVASSGASSGASSAAPLDGAVDAGDDWLLLVTSGTLLVTDTHLRPNAEEPPLSRQGSSSLDRRLPSLLHRFASSGSMGGLLGQRLQPGDLLACGREGEEALLASLVFGAPPSSPGQRATTLRLLQGRPERVSIEGADGAEARALRIPLSTFVSLASSVPDIVHGSFGVAAVLRCQPLFETLEPKVVDALAFSFAEATFAPGQQLHARGRVADSLHLVLAGTVELFTTRGGDCAEGAAASTVCGRCVRGDLVGYRSLVTEAKETTTAVALTGCLTLALDRSNAAQLPLQIRAALAERPDESLSFSPISPSEYTVLRQIARGTFGTVVRAEHKPSGQVVAVKKVPRSMVNENTLRQHLLAERAVLSTVRHPYMCALIGTHRDALSLFLVLELCDGPELYSVLRENGRFSTAVATLYAACIASALAHLHAARYIYRDLKAENVVFVPSGAVKLVDFGLTTRILDGMRLYEVCGSHEYMAPEVVQQSGYGCGADWWSFGCLLFELCFGHTPWVLDADGMPFYSQPEVISKRVVDPEAALVFPSDLPKPPSPELQSVLEALLRRNPNVRLGCSNAGSGELREHPFFATVDWTALVDGSIPFPPPPDVSLSDEPSEEDAHGSGGGKEEAGAIVDPLSAQLMRFMRLRALQETRPVTSESPVEPPVEPATPTTPPAGVTNASPVETKRGPFADFWDAPPYAVEDEGLEWDRDF